jgi:hypothetical protein
MVKISHPNYSCDQDLAPFVLLFSRVKTNLTGGRFLNVKGMLKNVTIYFAAFI